jgi:hypothetical protein
LEEVEMAVHSVRNYGNILRLFKQNKWVSADGRVTPIFEMDNLHLFHTIEMVHKNLVNKNFDGEPKMRDLMVAWLFRLQAEANMRGSLGRID